MSTAPRPSDGLSESTLKSIKELRKPGMIGYLTFLTALSALVTSIYSAYVYRSQLETSRDQEKVQLRSYVGPINMSIIGYKKPNFTMRFTVQNFGSTQGSKLDYGIIFDLVTKDRNGKFNIGEADEWKNDLGSLIFPGRQIYWDSDTAFNSIQIDNLLRADSLFTASGRIQYVDIFGNPHYTKFCFYFDQDDIMKATTTDLKDAAIDGTNCSVADPAN